MLAHPSPQDDHSRALGLDAHVIEAADVFNNVDDHRGRRLVRVKVEHVAEGAVGERGAEDGDVILSRWNEGQRKRKGDRNATGVGGWGGGKRPTL